MAVTIRSARPDDRAAIIQVEAGATPNLSYVDQVFDIFLADERGEFSVVEIDGKVVACGKFTVVPDGSAWLETIRVLPEFQGRGIGKRFYERFFELAQAQNVPTMRMYTGITNAASKGLAEHFGFQLDATFHGASLALPTGDPQTALGNDASTFRPVTDPAAATQLLLAQADEWGGYLVLNRTFYQLTPALCRSLVAAGQVYADAERESVIVAGARFMPQAALHVTHFCGDVAGCISFAAQLGATMQSKRLNCLFPAAADSILQSLQACGFQQNPTKLIVMERHL